MSSNLFEIKRHVVPCQHIRHYPRSTAQSQEDVLHMAVKQYIPKTNPNPSLGDITIIAAHANAVSKELYEPLWDDLLQCASQNSFRIRSIWIADVSFQGESFILNEDKTGDDPSWFDHSRDLLHLINTFRAQMPRPLVGIGHSMGGAQIAHLSLMHPRLFSGVVLMDPVIQTQSNLAATFLPAYASTFRKDVWPSREAAAESFRRNKFYQRFDPRAFNLFIEHNLRELPTALHPTAPPSSDIQAETAAVTATKPVTLTTTKHQEVMAFCRANHPPAGTPLSSHKPNTRTHPDTNPDLETTPFYRPEPSMILAQLPHLHPPCYYIFASDSPMSDPQLQAEKLDCTGQGINGDGGVGKEGGTESTVMADAGHFFCFEKPGEAAELVGKWVGKTMERWREAEERDRREWEGVGAREKAMLEPGREWWMKWVMEQDNGKRETGKAKL
ncbi:MAG: hypothetical protein M1831_000532 [Alyxoria varia]|nr:MAG: hypothetical protein M1831_000532 [Alyxoria varia]